MDAETQKGYPCVCYMASDQWARSRMRQGDFKDPALLQELKKGSDGLTRFRERRGGPFWSAETICHLLGAELHHRRGEKADDVSQLEDAEEARAAAIRLNERFGDEAES